MSKIYPIPLRYIDKEGKGYCDALMPSQVRIGCNAKGVYRCLGGELVHIEWLMVCNNTQGEHGDMLDKLSKDLYELPFSNIRSMWFARLGRIEDWWDKVRCRIVVEDEQDTVTPVPRTRGRRNSGSVR